MPAKSLSVLFRSAIEKYLKIEKPHYDVQSETFKIKEEKFQYRFLRELSHKEFSLRIEELYPNSDERYDILATSIDKNHPGQIYIELKWSAQWKDGFRKITFNDLEKLKRQTLPHNSIRAFFAFNITDKYQEFPDRWKEYRDPKHLPTEKETSFRALNNFWKNFKYKNNCLFYLKKYIDRGKKYNILLFCYVSDPRFL